MSTRLSQLFRPTKTSSVYLVAIGALAAVGFVQHSPAPILIAALLALPSSFVTLPLYYVGYGLLSFFPGANSSSSSGSALVRVNGSTRSLGSAGSTPDWFTITTHVLGTLALVVAATLNVMIVRIMVSRRRATRAMQ